MKKDLYFVGFLANVDDSILRLRIGNGFSIDKRQQEEAMPFLRKLEFHYGMQSGFGALNFGSDGRSSGCYCISKCFPKFVEGTSQGGIVVPIAKLKKIRQSLADKFRLLRLFKEGNILMQSMLFYHLSGSEPSVVQVGSERLLVDRNIFHLDDTELTQAEAFVSDTRIPFRHSFLQLAFASSELSYETFNRGLAFLSLMISIEALFSPGSETRYRVSRNAAVLLGANEDESQEIFDDMKRLYKTRSGIAHGGKSTSKVTSKDILGLRHYVRESIKSSYRLDLDKEALLKILDRSGFGHQP